MRQNQLFPKSAVVVGRRGEMISVMWRQRMCSNPRMGARADLGDFSGLAGLRQVSSRFQMTA
jgi:hypothetical protein